MSRPISATEFGANSGVHKSGKQPPQHDFRHQFCRLCLDNPYWYTNRSELLDHATVHHNVWYSSKLDNFMSITSRELGTKRDKLSKRQAHRRFRHDKTFVLDDPVGGYASVGTATAKGAPSSIEGGIRTRWGWGTRFGPFASDSWIAGGGSPYSRSGWES